MLPMIFSSKLSSTKDYIFEVDSLKNNILDIFLKFCLGTPLPSE